MRDPRETRVAVVDVETTGLFPQHHDRIVEIAIVGMNLAGEVLSSFSTLVNPQRDVGPTWKHGITGTEVLAAPTFKEIAAFVSEELRGAAAFVGHNARFDAGFVVGEFKRLGHDVRIEPLVCTMFHAGGGTLEACCEDFGVKPNGRAHEALTDALATCELLRLMLKDVPELLEHVTMESTLRLPNLGEVRVQSVSRKDAREVVQRQQTFLQRLVARSSGTVDVGSGDPGPISYGAMLDRALSDQALTADEGSMLFELAASWGMSEEKIHACHVAYLGSLVGLAFEDGTMSVDELGQIRGVAGMLGLSDAELAQALSAGRAEVPKTTGAAPRAQAIAAGSCLCFTGEGKMLRSEAETRAAALGFRVVGSVSKRVDLLVAADVFSQSGKASKARRLGVPIQSELEFWGALGAALT